MIAVLILILLGVSPAVAAPKSNGSAKVAKAYKSDDEVSRRKNANPVEISSVIVTLQPGAQLPNEFKRFARGHGRLNIINGQVLDLPNGVIAQLEKRPEIFRVHYNRPIGNLNYRTSITTGARAARLGFGVTGAGVGVAIIDSGIASWHDDLTSTSGQVQLYGNQRVAAFVDFVNGGLTPYDDHGHGTHVAGIIAGNAYDSEGEKAGMAPEATLVSLKVLDAQGRGTIGNVIAALDWVVANRQAYNIRVVNVSVGAGVHESYLTDPLTLAAKRAVDAGVIVVAASGNLGKNAAGAQQYGGITAPANAPWVLTVGASNSNGTSIRGDDAIAGFSSRGPTYLDWSAKPDLVAPGVGIVSLADPTSAYFTSKAERLISGSVPTAFQPYLSLSGTSMAAPAVTGTIALMLQSNPALTPNAVKAILQFTAEVNAGYNPLTQGAGFLNALGAVRLARYFAHPVGLRYPIERAWSKRIIWGNHMVSGGVLLPWGNAWNPTTTWGAARAAGDNIVWGTLCAAGCDNIVWGTDDNIVWGTGTRESIVWGTEGDDNIVWGTDDNIVWGTDDNIVWGTDCGGADCDNIVWGTVGIDNIVWGTRAADDNIVWGTVGIDNIVWGTNGVDNIVWGTEDRDNIVWGTEADDNIVWGTAANGNTGTYVARSSWAVLLDYYYAIYAAYADLFTDGQFYDYTDMIVDWVNSQIAAERAPATGTTIGSTRLP